MVELGLLGMFIAAFAAATILPLQSELIFSALQVANAQPLWLLILVASVGNTLGSIVTYAMGRGIERFRDKKGFPFNQSQMDRAQKFFQKWGLWSLLLTWAPLGDAIAFVAGIMRTPWPIFVILVAAAKTGRYIVLALITNGVISAL